MSVEDTLLVFADSAGVPHRWRLLSGGAVVGRGDEVAELPEARPWVRVVLAVPGTDVTLHWLELAENLTAVQAAAAARLQIAEEAPEPVSDLHIAAGRIERGLTCVAVVPTERMSAWIAAARTLRVEPDIILPAPLLLMAPGEGLVRYAGGPVPDYRGVARAFSLEDELAAVLIGDVPVSDIDDSGREAGFGPALATPAINLRQGVFARRREWAIDWPRVRRMAALAAVLLLLSLAIQLVTIMRTTFAADRVQAEATELREATPGTARLEYAPIAGVLFEAVRDTPNVTLTQVVYQPDGTLRASLLADTPATLDQVRGRIEARGLQAVGALPTDMGGRAALQMTIRRP
ncbi:MAG: type II secretion system protein GspL [Allosphingosinicella sp.]|uniref:type II secretion system protein GspL n=1 Tax=Allosphingosinicella sp. TaxID=2823234 RepID=UPI00392A23DE